MPGREQADLVMEKAFDGGMALTFRPAVRTVRPGVVVRRVSGSFPIEELASYLGVPKKTGYDCWRQWGLRG